VRGCDPRVEKFSKKGKVGLFTSKEKETERMAGKEKEPPRLFYRKNDAVMVRSFILKKECAGRLCV